MVTWDLFPSVTLIKIRYHQITFNYSTEHASALLLCVRPGLKAVLCSESTPYSFYVK